MARRTWPRVPVHAINFPLNSIHFSILKFRKNKKKQPYRIRHSQMEMQPRIGGPGGAQSGPKWAESPISVLSPSAHASCEGGRWNKKE